MSTGGVLDRRIEAVLRDEEAQAFLESVLVLFGAREARDVGGRDFSPPAELKELLARLDVLTPQQLIDLDFRRVQKLADVSLHEIRMLDTFVCELEESQQRGQEDHLREQVAAVMANGRHAEEVFSRWTAAPDLADAVGEVFASEELAELICDRLNPENAAAHQIGTLLRLRYGFDDGKAKTYGELSPEAGVTAARVQQLLSPVIREGWLPGLRPGIVAVLRRKRDDLWEIVSSGSMNIPESEASSAALLLTPRDRFLVDAAFDSAEQFLDELFHHGDAAWWRTSDDALLGSLGIDPGRRQDAGFGDVGLEESWATEDGNGGDSFRTLKIKPEYRTGESDPVRDLYKPALLTAMEYRRAVGFFSSSAFESIGAPMGSFVKRGGTMRLITSVRLDDEDRDAIERGKSLKLVANERLLRVIEQDFREPVGKGSRILANLMAAGRLELRIAVTTEGRGLYHEKLGLFFDPHGDFLAFSGSANESATALGENYECIDVFQSWKDPQGRARLKAEHFDRLWAGEVEGIATFDAEEALTRSLIQTVLGGGTPGTSTGSPDEESADPYPLWEHQQEAMDAFLEAGSGVVEMATGTGKSRLALVLMYDMLERGKINSVILATDGTDLLDQWVEHLQALSSRLSARRRVLRHFDRHKGRSEYILDPGRSLLAISRPQLAEVLTRLTTAEKQKIMVVHDEVHRLGSPGNVAKLSGLLDDVPHRLGLSATPDREYDADGNAFIESHVGPVIYRFGLEEAIARGILCEFDYFPLEYEPSEEDHEEIQKVYKLAAAKRNAGEPMRQEDIWIMLARVFKRSRTKIPLFRDFIETRPDVLERCIVFVEDRDFGEDVIDLVHARDHRFHTYYADDDRKNLELFAVGTLNSLITCHRISEGIDIRSVRAVVLFASAASRLETIQRLGRCLRTDPRNPAKRAIVVDFVRAQDQEREEMNADQHRAEWLDALSQCKRTHGEE